MACCVNWIMLKQLTQGRIVADDLIKHTETAGDANDASDISHQNNGERSGTIREKFFELFHSLSSFAYLGHLCTRLLFVSEDLARAWRHVKLSEIRCMGGLCEKG